MHQSVSRSIAFYWGLTLIIKIVAYYMIHSVGGTQLRTNESIKWLPARLAIKRL